MKIQLTFKTPDVVYECLQRGEFDSEEPYETEFDSRKESLIKNVTRILEKYLRYGEILTVELDTETETMEVIPCK